MNPGPSRMFEGWSCTLSRSRPSGFHRSLSSGQATPRHPGLSTYGCWLPPLTGFVAPCRAGPNPQHITDQHSPTGPDLKREFDPGRASSRVQGIANSPSSTTVPKCIVPGARCQTAPIPGQGECIVTPATGCRCSLAIWSARCRPPWKREVHPPCIRPNSRLTSSAYCPILSQP